MRATLWRSILAACSLAAGLSGCAAGQVGEAIPHNLGGMPADVPAAPRVPYQYPAVHDMPPPRATEPLTDEQQFRLEQDLTTLRNRQEKRLMGDKTTPQPAKSKTGKKAGKKKSKGKAGGGDGKTTGAKTSP
jgi:hypothetical protein